MALRNNQDRLGPPKGAGDTPLVTNNEQEAPKDVPQAPVSFSTPTKIVDLPSKGRFYPEGHPLHNCDTIEIRFMTAKEEDILTSKSLLKKGIAIDRMLQSLLINKGINVNDLLIGDKNALTVAARISGYGNVYSTNVTCPNCNAVNQWTFDLEESNVHDGVENLPDGVELTSENTYKTTLPASKAVVEFRPLTGHDEARMIRTMKARQRNGMGESSLTDQYKNYIVSINGEKDGRTIHSFVENMPAMDSRHLRTVYQQSVPNTDLTQGFVCVECTYDAEMEVPFTTDFFWPK